MSTRWVLFFLLVAGLAIRLGWSLSRPADPEALTALPDQVEYLQSAQSLMAGDRISFYDARFNQVIYAARTPGYPVFLAACNANVTLVRIAQSLVDVSTALAVYLLARRWLSPGRSLIACAIAVVNPLQVYFVSLLLTETLYVSMLAWSAYLITFRRWISFGLILGAISVLVRPSGLIVPVVLGFVAAWVHFGSGHRLAWAIAYAICAAVFTIAALSPWAIRNEKVLGQLVWLTTQSGITLYDGIHPEATGASDQSFLDKHPNAASMSELERDMYFRELARKEIRANPRRFASLALTKAARTWSPVPLSEQFSANRVYLFVGLFYAIPLFAAAFVAVFFSNLRIPVRLYLLAPAIAFTLIHAMSVGSMRYRLPAEPLLAVLATSAFGRKAVARQDDQPRSRDGAKEARSGEA